MTASAYSDRAQVLFDLLDMLVPLRIHELAPLTDEERRALITPDLIEAVTVHGDTVVGGAYSRADHLNRRVSLTAIVTGLAVGAYQPGGATFAHLHWEAPDAG